MAGPEISVVVPVRDGSRSLPALLDAFAGQTLDRLSFEVVVDDNGSREGSAQLARARVARRYGRQPDARVGASQLAATPHGTDRVCTRLRDAHAATQQLVRTRERVFRASVVGLDIAPEILACRWQAELH